MPPLRSGEAMHLTMKTKMWLHVDMVNYVKNDMLAEFPKAELQEQSIPHANKNLFKINEHSPPLSNLKREEFHTIG